jgi:para-nitrobenzyl esterase
LKVKELQSATSRKSPIQRRRFLRLAGMAAGGALWSGVESHAEALRGASYAPVVETAAGLVRGRSSSAAMYAYLGVPYAHAERFAAPTAAQPWPGIREAKAFIGEAPESDLHLNVWTPAGTALTARPVWVWIPGGGFNTGTSGATEFDGAAAAERGGAVVVTVNHRAGLFGYVDLEGLAAANHAGNLDLAESLRWVRQNIRGFGGDPGNVTILSGIGGEPKICCLLAMPAARGLFHRAFLQMGAAGHRAQRRASGQELTAALLQELRLDASQVGALRSLPAGTLLAAAAAAKAKLPGDVAAEFCPVSDGKILPASWFESATLAADDPTWPTLTKSSSTESHLHRGHFSKTLDTFPGPELGRVRTTRFTFTWPPSSSRATSAHSVEVVTNHVSGSQGRRITGPKLRTIAANAALLTLAGNPRA